MGGKWDLVGICKGITWDLEKTTICGHYGHLVIWSK